MGCETLGMSKTWVAPKPEMSLLQATLRTRAAGARSVEELEGLASPSRPAPRACYHVECINSVAAWLMAAPGGGATAREAAPSGELITGHQAWSWWRPSWTGANRPKQGGSELEGPTLSIVTGGTEMSFWKDRRSLPLRQTANTNCTSLQLLVWMV